MVRRSTLVALLLAVLVLTAVVGYYTRHLRAVARLGPPAHVDWSLWWLAVAVGYLGLGLVGWYAVARDRRGR